MQEFEIPLGSSVIDPLSGFTGKVTGTVSYITGCDQVLVQPGDLDKDGNPKGSKWIDIDRCELLEDEIYVLPGHRRRQGREDSAETRAPIGPDKQAPIR